MNPVPTENTAVFDPPVRCACKMWICGHSFEYNRSCDNYAKPGSDFCGSCDQEFQDDLATLRA